MYNSRGKTKVLLSLFLISALVLALFSSLNKTPKPTEFPHLHVQNHLQIAHSKCEGTLYRDLCVSTLSALPDLASKSQPELISAVVNKTMSEVKLSSSNCSGIEKHLRTLNTLEQRALDDCLELLDDTMAELKSTLSDLSPKNSPSKHYHDLQTLLSAAMTNQFTCLDGFAYSKGHVRDTIKSNLYNISRHVSNSLVLLKKMPGVKKASQSEDFPEYGRVKNGFPSWVSSKDRKLLQSSVNETKFDLIVAKDGTGNFTTISEAVAAAPNSSNTRFVIYIKAGAYFENVEVERKKSMVMFLGDGIGKTVVKASRNVVDGWTTFRSATVGESFENLL